MWGDGLRPHDRAPCALGDGTEARWPWRSGTCSGSEAVFTRHLDSVHLEIDNNACERSLRAVAVGRKNWQFAGSRFGDKAAAAWFSLIGSAKLHEVEPWAYLTDVTTRLAHLGDAPSDEELMPLLPDRWIAANPQARLPVSREPREQPIDGIERRRRFSNAYLRLSTTRFMSRSLATSTRLAPPPRIGPHAVGLPAKPGHAPRHATGRPPSGLTGKSRPRVPLLARFGANQPVAQGAARLCGRALGARARARVPPRGCDSTAQPFIRIAANERTRTTLADGSYWQYVYDDLGEVSSGKRYSSTGAPIPGQQFEYTFDDIGNRTQAKAGGDASGNNLRTANYTSNLLNMYTGRGSPGSVDIMGYAPLASYPVSITTGGSTVPVDFRLLEYYQKKLSWTNSAAARFEQVLVESDPTHAGSEKELWVFLPKDPEAFTHDVDGNLLQDGRWNYGWDGENRLIWMESRTDLPTAMPRQRVEFGYDFMSRRNVKRMYVPVAVAEITGGPLGEPETIGATTSVIDGATASVAGPGSDAAPETLPAWAVSAPVGWTQVGLSKYVWDGWNLLAELDIMDASVRTFAWGLDLSGSEQGAGGIGGLVLGWTRANGTLGGEVNGTGGNTLRYVFDGNGNVMAALDDLGRARAKYEYGPFGETLTSEGDLAADNPIRWSTKYTDGESGLVYYGYRYYNAGTGRWLNRDPIEELGGVALFTNCGNDVINFLDPLGLEPIDTRTPQQKKDDMCRALQQAVSDGMSLEDFVKKYNPTWGKNTSAFYQSHGSFNGKDIDIDWLLTLLHANKHGVPGKEWATQGVSLWWLYHIGKPYWIISDSISDEERSILDFFKRFRQQEELDTIDLGNEILDGKQNIYDVLASMAGCTLSTTVPPCSNQSPKTFDQREGEREKRELDQRNNDRNKRTKEREKRDWERGRSRLRPK